MEKEISKEPASGDNESILKVNFNQYQTDELRTAIEEILSITGNITFFLRTLMLVWVTGPIIMFLLFTDSAVWVRLIWSFYGALSFFFLAVSFGIFFTKRRLLRNMQSIVDVIFEVCCKVLDDLGHIRSRGIGITAVTLVSNVDSSVIRPVVEGVIRSKLGFLSRPLLWMYRGTIGKIIEIIENTLAKMAAEEDEGITEQDNPQPDSEEQPKNLIQLAENATLSLRDFIKSAHEVSLTAARKITKYAMIPSFLLSLVFFMIAFLPVLIVKI